MVWNHRMDEHTLGLLTSSAQTRSPEAIDHEAQPRERLLTRSTDHDMEMRDSTENQSCDRRQPCSTIDEDEVGSRVTLNRGDEASERIVACFLHLEIELA